MLFFNVRHLFSRKIVVIRETLAKNAPNLLLIALVRCLPRVIMQTVGFSTRSLVSDLSSTQLATLAAGEASEHCSDLQRLPASRAGGSDLELLQPLLICEQ